MTPRGATPGESLLGEHPPVESLLGEQLPEESLLGRASPSGVSPQGEHGSKATKAIGRINEKNFNLCDSDLVAKR